MSKPEFIHHLDDFYDYLKHLTTLATGLIALVVTFREKFATNGQGKALMQWSIGLLLCCVVLSVACMFFTLTDRTTFASTMMKTAAGLTFYGSALAFVAGLICLALYGGKSL